MDAETVRDLEHRFDVGGRVYVVQVCSPHPHSAAPISAGAFDAQIVTCAADELSDFNNDDPEFLAQRVVVDISTRLPNVPDAELAAFCDEIVAWIVEHRRVASNDFTLRG
jgi:hypothetical protein